MNQFYVAPLGGISLAPQLMDIGNRLRDDRKAEADKQAKMQRFSEVKSAMEEAYSSGDPEQMAKVSMVYPEAQKTMESLIGFQSDKTKKQGIETYRKALALSGDPQAAVNSLNSRIEFLIESGANPKDTQEDRDQLQSALNEGRDTAPIFKEMEMAFAGLAPEEYKAFKGGSASDAPGAVRETEWFMKQPKSVQEEHLKLKRKTDPTMAEKLDQARSLSDIKVNEAGGKAAATGIAGRQQGFIDAGVDAADSISNITRSIELLKEVETGGFDSAAIKAKQLFGIESADEGELANALGLGVLQQLKPIFGAAFTAQEGDRLERLSAGFGRNPASNRRILEKQLEIAKRAANRAIRAAEDAGDKFTADEIRSAMSAVGGVANPEEKGKSVNWSDL